MSIAASVMVILLSLAAVPVTAACALTAYSPSCGSQSDGGGLKINEVFYDPDGPDQGKEFVEIVNTGAEPASLGGWALLAGDGARPGTWATIWQGSSGDSVRPGRVFLVAEAEVPGADAYAQLGLQNGPDCCALALNGLHADVVGWGDHEHSECYEGNAAPDVPSGHSLARWPDGCDSGDNSADFVDCPRPTPGRRNALEKDLTFGPVPIETCPINPEPHDLVTISASVANAGLGANGADPFTLLLHLRAAGDGRPIQVMAIPSALAPGDTAILDAAWNGAIEGAFVIEAILVCAGDQDTSSNEVRAFLRVGPGPVIVNEIMYDPSEGGEWIEIYNRGSDSQDLCGWSVLDNSRACLTLPANAIVPPDGYLVVAQDSASFVQSYHGVNQSSVIGSYAGRWPSLNNSDGPGGLADVVTLSDRDGLLSDRAAYSERIGGSRGTSLERVRADLVGGRTDNWCPSGGLAGATPGEQNSVRAGTGAARGVLSLEPSLIDTRDKDGSSAVSYSLPFKPSRLRLSVYSMHGLEVARLVDRKGGPSKGTVLWHGRDSQGEILAAGVYVLLLVAGCEDGQRSAAKAVAVVR